MDKMPVRSTRNQTGVEATTTANANDDCTVDTNQANSGYPFDFVALKMDIRDTVAAVVEDKMAVITDKLDTIQTTLDGNTKRLEEAENRISDAEDTIANTETRMMQAERRLNHADKPNG